MSKPTPTFRTIQLMESRGYLAGIVERNYGRRTFDLFGLADVLAVKPGPPTELVLIQATSDMNGGNSAKRVAKIRALPGTVALLQRAGFRIMVHAWRPLTDQGWQCREIELEGGAPPDERQGA